MKTLPVILLTLAAAVPATWFAARELSGRWFTAGGPKPAESAERKILHYQSAMHPWIKSDKPGNCTICGMQLTPIYEGERDLGSSADGIVGLSQNQIQMLHVQTAEVKTQPVLKTLRVAGRIDDDATRHRVLSAYLDGRIERLHVNFVGAEVTAGQPLAEVYSPALLQAEREYRQLTGELQQRTALRLRQMGLSPAQIEVLPRKDPNSLVSEILSPIGGSVTAKNIFEGQYVKEGEKLFEIADFSTMWFVFQAYEQDLPWINLGQMVDVTTPSRPGRTFTGRITFLDPNFDEALRATKVRVELANPLLDGRRALLHRLYAEGTVRIEMPASLSVPRSAIIETGAEAVVYVDEGGGAYGRRVIKTGRRGDDLVEVLGGVKEGQKVVTNGNLLIDGQTEMNRAFAAPPEASATVKAIPALTQSQTQAISDFVKLADGMSAALSADDLGRFNEASASVMETTGALVEAIKDQSGLTEVLAKLSVAAHFDSFGDLLAARKAFHGFTLAATAALEPVRTATGTPDFGVFECSMVDQAIAGVPPKGRWLQVAGRQGANPFFGSKMLDCAVEIKP